MSSYFLDVKSQFESLGGKAKNLVKLVNQNFPVPPFVVVSSDIDEPIDWPMLINELESVSSTWPGSHFAVRSSAHDEDSATHSFAGQFDTVLGVLPQDIEHAVNKVWASVHNERVKSYRLEQGLSPNAKKPAVIIQTLIPSEVSGVAFSKNPVDPDAKNILISAVYGLGESLVDGSEDASNYWVDTQGNVTEQKATQTQAKYLINSKVQTLAVTDELNSQPVLSTDEAKKIAELCQRSADFFNAPQDIEWALHNGKLWLLQSRNITTLASPATGEYRLWDNSNIAESYSGITTPLTYSFARYVYQGVYQQFVTILGVSKERIAKNEQALRSMLGLHNGSVYYNMNSWYKVLAMLPGFQFNRKLMEQMMGVKEGLPSELAESLNQTSSWAKSKDAMNLIATLFKLAWLNYRLPNTIKEFTQRFEFALSQTEPTQVLSLEAAVNAYNHLERKLLRAWDAPLINDFFAMIFVGVLAKLCDKWLGDANIHGALLSASGDIISAQPAKCIAHMAQLISDDSTWIERLATGDVDLIQGHLASHPELNSQLNSYLREFSDRCIGELKLESLTLMNDPRTLYLAIAAQARTPNNREAQKAIDVTELTSPLSKFKRKVFHWVLKQARARVRDRENLRFERTRLFGRVRSLIIIVAEELVRQEKLNQVRDIFYLEISEITGLVDATNTIGNLKALVEIRKQEFESFKQDTMPDRFETRGPTIFAAKQPREIVPKFTDHFKGTGACPGIVKAQVRVVTDPSNAKMVQGEILVAQQTDPGWVMLFPMASGLLVERGSLLSHSAIVARELGIPAVVSIPQLMSHLKTGDWVMMNGKTGEVWKIDPKDESSQ